MDVLSGTGVALGIIIALLALWNVGRPSKRREYVIVLLGTVGATVAIAQWVQGSEEAAKAAERIASADRELAAAKKRLAHRVEALTPEHLDALVSALKEMPKAPIEIAVLDEPEPIELGEVLVGAFRRAGWPIVKAQKQVFWFPTTNGVHLEVAELPGPKCAPMIVDALTGMGLEDVRILVPERKPEQGFRLFVGRKENGER